DAKPKPKTAAAYQTSINEDLDVVTREEWGAREHIPHNPGVHNYEEYQGDLSDALHSIAIHHSGNSNKHEMSEVQDHHMDSPDYDLADVGYHYGINLKGEIVEGRPIGVKGSHISKGNTGVIGIVFLADLNEQWWDFDDAMSKKMEATLLSLIRTLQGNFKKIQFLGGHQEYNEGRSCPGNIPMAKMEGWRSAVGLKKPKLVTHK
ncbi:MAG TPA: N-acetylmuramoyl-L-alanine amidase, partial [Bacteroidetes bacterium]|nr:N-acetylmuramoyl-L-alanine amidase [Bacteroidota bacterium]